MLKMYKNLSLIPGLHIINGKSNVYPIKNFLLEALKMARKSNRVRIYKPPKSRRGWNPRKGKKQKRKQVVLESKMIQRHTTGQISNEISPSWTQTQSERDHWTVEGTVSPTVRASISRKRNLSLKRFYR